MSISNLTKEVIHKQSNVSILTVLTELRDFRAENNKRWEENNKRWEENNKRWEENDKRLSNIETRVSDLEEGRKEDRKELIEIIEQGRKEDRKQILDIFDTMQKSIDGQFTRLENLINDRCDGVENEILDLRKNQINDRKLLYKHEARLKFYGARIGSLEEWRNEINDGGFVNA